MDNIDKKEKKSQENRRNYMRRKDELQERSKENRARIKKELSRSRRGSPSLLSFHWVHKGYHILRKKDLSLQRVFLTLLVVACTYYLLHETVTYLQVVEGNSAQAWLKAFISEGLLIAFSWLSFQTFSLKIARIVILIGMCAYSLSAISGNVVWVSQKRLTSSSVNQKLIEDLEKDLVRKEVAYQRFLSQGMTGAMRKQERQLDTLRSELTALRKNSTQMQTPGLIGASLITLLSFRLLVMLANMILIHRLSSSFRKSIDRTHGSTRPNLVLVSG